MSDGSDHPSPLRLAPVVQRRPSAVVAGLLVTVLCAVISGALYLRADDRVTVLSVVRPVPAGHPLTAGDVQAVRVAVDGVPVVPDARRADVLGLIAATDLVPGSLLNPSMLTDQPVPAPGQAIVGVALRAGQLPAHGLHPGDRVRVVRTPAASDQQGPEVLARAATVHAVGSTPDETTTTVSLLVDEGSAPAIAQAAHDAEISVVLVARAS